MAQRHPAHRLLPVAGLNALIHNFAVFPVGADEQHQKPVPPVLGEGVAPAQAVVNRAGQKRRGLGDLLGVGEGVALGVHQPVQQQAGALAGALDHAAAHAVYVDEAGVAAIVGAPLVLGLPQLVVQLKDGLVAVLIGKAQQLEPAGQLGAGLHHKILGQGADGLVVYLLCLLVPLQIHQAVDAQAEKFLQRMQRACPGGNAQQLFPLAPLRQQPGEGIQTVEIVHPVFGGGGHGPVVHGQMGQKVAGIQPLRLQKKLQPPVVVRRLGGLGGLGQAVLKAGHIGEDGHRAGEGILVALQLHAHLAGQRGLFQPAAQLGDGHVQIVGRVAGGIVHEEGVHQRVAGNARRVPEQKKLQHPHGLGGAVVQQKRLAVHPDGELAE